MTEFNFPNTIEMTAAVAETEAVEFHRGAEHERGLAYWSKHLAGIPAILELPTDRPRPPAQSLRQARHSVLLPSGLTANLALLAEREGTPLSVLLLGAFQSLLHRYTRQADIVVGAILPGDSRFERAAADGRYGLTALPVRADLGSNPGFRSLLRSLTAVVEAAREHDNVSWPGLVNAVDSDCDASRHPVFQVLFCYDVSEGSRSARDAAELSGRLAVDLELRFVTNGEHLEAQFTYSTDLFDEGTIVRMVTHFENLLEGVVTDPDEKVSGLPLLTETEREKLVSEWNNTWTEYPRNLCLHQLFETQAQRNPDATAVEFENQRLTYNELNRRANQVARHLVKLGVGPNILVGICVERSLEMVVGLLGILKAGGAYVPVDPAFPQERIAFMLEDAEAPVLLTQQRLVAALPKNRASQVRLDTDWTLIAAESTDNLPTRAKAEDVAYTIYTSGSTGKPKGVQIPHRAVVNFLLSMAEKPGMTPQDRLLAVTTLSFDIAGLELYLPLIVGASVEIVSRSISSDGTQLLPKLMNSGATVMQATPATWRMLLEAGWQSSPNLKILVGGEAVPAKLAAQLMQRAASVWNMYGPTETTIWSTIRKFHPQETSVAIGRPIANTELFVLDKLLQPVPVGVAGELLIGGDGLAKGYFKRPELTAEKFIPHPFRQAPGARLYRTGDLVRYRPNGDVEFLGRIDHQIKIRGFRIELGEIEAVLRQHSAINETVVVAREDVPGDQRLVAYFVPIGDRPCSVTDLRSFLEEHLPKYMLPSAFVSLAHMPLTPNGKINRRELPAPSPSDLIAIKEELIAARDATERQLVGIWESVLGMQPVGVTQDFFDLGGHSLLAVRLMTRIDQAFGQKLPVTTLLQARTIERMAKVIRQGGASSPWSSLVPIQTSGSKPPLFCVHGAGGVVIRFLELARHLGPDQPVYGLQARGLDGRYPCDTKVGQMAAHYLEEIRSVQPTGPYLFAGYSLGGLIAIEMAQTLIAENRGTVLVVLFDTFCPTGSGANGANGSARGLLYERLSKALQTWVSLSVSEKWKELSRIAKISKNGIHRRVAHLMLPRSLKQVRGACETAAKTYVPRSYPGRLILFRSLHRPLLQLADPHAAWSRYAEQGLEIYEVEGNHDSILLEPQVRVVAEQLKDCLQSAAE
jgi:amino acid adenylation domain-containing protein